MVDDNLNFTDDFAEFTLKHQSVSNFIKDESLWLNPDLNEIVSKREEVVKITDNKFKDINFLAENKLVFMFQKNIVRIGRNQNRGYRTRIYVINIDLYKIMTYI